MAKLQASGMHGAAVVETVLIGLREPERLGSPGPALSLEVRPWFVAPPTRTRWASC
ncbi:hypothetical protein ACI2TD_17740 [Ralstonia nicotianae]